MTPKNKQGKSTKLSGSKLYARARVTNGSSLLPNIDGRSVSARRLRDLIQIHASDLGGKDCLSAAEYSLVRRASLLTLELEHLESKFLVNGAAADQLDLYTRTASALRRILEAVGIKRSVLDLSPRDRDRARIATVIDQVRERREQQHA